jgi:hypothetical protein
MRTSLALPVFSTLLVASCSQTDFGAALNKLRGDAYPLDGYSRDANPGDACPEVALVTYQGGRVRFQPAARVAQPFVARLVLFERVLVKVSEATYGRAPRTLRHAGAYVCRPIRARASRWSEHAYGNAIDVMGFDFVRPTRADLGAAADAGAVPLSTLPAALRRPFQVSVLKHWQASEPSELGQLHREFLHRLIDELDSEDVFRALIGPADPNHRNHFHLDMGPWRYKRV